MNKGYQIYLQTDHWKQLRKKKIKSKRRCFVCRSTQNLHVHHLEYRHLYDVKSIDLKVMCRRCHFLAHDLVKERKIVFTKDNHKHKMDRIIRTLRPMVCEIKVGSKVTLQK